MRSGSVKSIDDRDEIGIGRVWSYVPDLCGLDIQEVMKINAQTVIILVFFILFGFDTYALIRMNRLEDAIVELLRIHPELLVEEEEE